MSVTAWHRHHGLHRLQGQCYILARFKGLTGHLLKGFLELGEVPIERFKEDCHAVVVLFVDAVGDHHLQILPMNEQDVLDDSLAHRKSALLVDDYEVGLDSLWSQVLNGNGLQLKGILLEVFKSNLKENFICRINFLDPILRIFLKYTIVTAR